MELQGQRIVVEKTYEQMAALILAEELNPFLWYKIIDRGDRGLVFRAASTNRLESDGIRYMLCPATYATGTDAYGNDWIGMWNSIKQATATEGQLTIWNGLVWVAGAILSGDSPDTEASGWTAISKASFTNHEYVEMIFDVIYDFDDDWISKQSDKKGNIFGLNKTVYLSNYTETDYESINLIDYCDWNDNNLYSNICAFVFNNTSTGISYNNCVMAINNNHECGGIQFNYCVAIFDNLRISSGILANNLGLDSEISNCIDFSTIQKNKNNGSISGCTSIGGNHNIQFCVNNGSITGTWDADVTDPVVDKTGTAE